MTTLIASLGQSPAVITETLDHLRDENKLTFDRLVLIAPGKLPLAQNIKQAGFLENGKDFSILESAPPNPGYPSEVIWSMDMDYDLMTNMDDIRTEEDAVAFYSAVRQLTYMWCYSEDVYYAIAGGRKSMSALMAMAAQFLPVKKIFHILMNDPDQIQDEVARKIRDDDTLMKYLVDIAHEGADSSDAETFRMAFHPGKGMTELVEIPFKQSFDSNIVKAIKSQLEQDSCRFDDFRKAIYRYYIKRPELQAPPAHEHSVHPDRLFGKNSKKQSELTDEERVMTHDIAEELMKAIPQIRLIEHHYGGGRKSKDQSDRLHCYDRQHMGRFETMFPVSQKPPLRVRLHLITTAQNNEQMDFLWNRIKEYCGEAFFPSPAVLISTLGESPGIVTSGLHFYETRGMRFEKVVVVAPDNEIIRQNCKDILERQPCLKGRLVYEEFNTPDVRKQTDLDELLKKMKVVVEKYINQCFQIYLNLSGGRKVMSGALLILAQLYEVEEAFHLSILDDELDRDIERYGDWRKLKAMENMDRILYPDEVTALNLNRAIRP